jgi:uncharacterized lipoprotein
MAVKTWYRASGVVGAAAVLVLVGCGSDQKKESSGDTLSRAASGDLATNGAPAGRTAIRLRSSGMPSTALAPAT